MRANLKRSYIHGLIFITPAYIRVGLGEILSLVLSSLNHTNTGTVP